MDTTAATGRSREPLVQHLEALLAECAQQIARRHRAGLKQFIMNNNDCGLFLAVVDHGVTTFKLWSTVGGKDSLPPCMCNACLQLVGVKLLDLTEHKQPVGNPPTHVGRRLLPARHTTRQHPIMRRWRSTALPYSQHPQKSHRKAHSQTMYKVQHAPQHAEGEMWSQAKPMCQLTHPP